MTKTEEKILEEAEEIKKAQKRIEEEEKRILASESKILTKIKEEGINPLGIEPGLTSKEIGIARLLLIGKITRHKLISALLITLGTVLIWRGLWEAADHTPYLSYGGVSLIVGVLIIWFLRKYNDLH